MDTTPIVVSAYVHAPLARVWEYYTASEHVTQWNYASDDWYCPTATSDFVVGGHFSYTMAAKDGSASFDFGGTFTEIIPQERIAYTIDDDGRKVFVTFAQEGENVCVTVVFEPEQINSHQLQQGGWQAILDNFTQYIQTQILNI